MSGTDQNSPRTTGHTKMFGPSESPISSQSNQQTKALPVSDPQEMRQPPQPPRGKQDDLIGSLLGGCRILDTIGRGGMGAVYLAEQLSLGRHVAIKVIRGLDASDPESVARFQSEARVVASLSHPNILHIHDVGVEGRVHFIIMEMVKGQNLRQLVRTRGPLAPELARSLLIQALAGLASAHVRGIIHRDLKPANLLLTEQGQLKLADFGLAKVLHADESLTTTGAILGTPAYMSPEAAVGHPSDARSDIYSLGATFYHLLSGKTPYSAETPLAVLQQVLHTSLPPLGALGNQVDPELSSIVSRMMEKKPEDRFQSCSELLQVLGAEEFIPSPASGDSNAFLRPGRQFSEMATINGTEVSQTLARQPRSRKKLAVFGTVLTLIAGIGAYQMHASGWMSQQDSFGEGLEMAQEPDASPSSEAIQTFEPAPSETFQASLLPEEPAQVNNQPGKASLQRERETLQKIARLLKEFGQTTEVQAQENLAQTIRGMSQDLSKKSAQVVESRLLDFEWAALTVRLKRLSDSGSHDEARGLLQQFSRQAPHSLRNKIANAQTALLQTQVAQSLEPRCRNFLSLLNAEAWQEAQEYFSEPIPSGNHRNSRRPRSSADPGGHPQGHRPPPHPRDGRFPPPPRRGEEPPGRRNEQSGASRQDFQPPFQEQNDLPTEQDFWEEDREDQESREDELASARESLLQALGWNRQAKTVDCRLKEIRAIRETQARTLLGCEFFTEDFDSWSSQEQLDWSHDRGTWVLESRSRGR